MADQRTKKYLFEIMISIWNTEIIGFNICN